MTSARETSLVTTDWLADHLSDPGLVLLDVRFNLPGSPVSGAEEYAASHIAGAHFFNVDHIADKASPLPHMLPDPAAFAAAMEGFGISDDSRVVLYDGPGMIAAGRAWWMLRIYGFDAVAVLDGGFRKWVAEGRPVTSDVPAKGAGRFTPRFRPELVRDRAQMLGNLASHAEDVVDARSAARFTASVPEPRPGLRGGHIPGSFNLPFGQVTDAATGAMKSDAEIVALFEAAGVDLEKPVVATCGSGVTSCALAFALHLTGKDDVAIYDGSWSEWGLPGDTPVQA
jgi:thiosulfate/3-mercaptopyruvate sulfurtransferase